MIISESEKSGFSWIEKQKPRIIKLQRTLIKYHTINRSLTKYSINKFRDRDRFIFSHNKYNRVVMAHSATE